MVQLEILEFRKLKAFFTALQQGKFRDRQTLAMVTVDGVPTPVNRTEVLAILRSKFANDFPGDKFKDDEFLINYLKNPARRNHLLGQLRQDQQFEIAQSLQEQTPTEEASTQSISETSGEQAGTMQSQTETAGNSSPMPVMRGLPSASISSPARRIVYQAPKTPVPEKPEIVTTNKSGVVLEKPTPVQKPTIVTANSSGALKGLGGEQPSKLIFPTNNGTFTKEQPLRFQSGWKSSFKTGFSNSGIFAKNNAGRILNSLRGMAGGVTGGAIRGGGDLLVRGLNGNLPGRQTFSSHIQGVRQFAGAGQSQLAKMGGGGKKWAFALVGSMILVGGLAAFGNPGGEQPIAHAGPVIGGGNIADCQFYRAKDHTSYKSNLLLGYIAEASNLTGIPPAVLAAFIKVESASTVTMTDDQIRNYAANCDANTSNTGALGIMQIQPPGTTSKAGDPASCEDCIDAGAKLLGKTVQTMTKADYCDPRTNIIVGSGFILKKMDKLGYKNPGKWDPAWTNDRKAIDALVNTYYGCLKYGAIAASPDEVISCDNPLNTENYGNDVWTSIQNCKSTYIATCPVPEGKISTYSYSERPDIGHCSPGYLAEGRCREDCPGGVGGSRRAKAIDVPTNGRVVSLPTVNGQSVNWSLKVRYPVEAIDGGGQGLVFEAQSGPDTWTFDILHMANTNLTLCTNYPSGCTPYRSGTPIGKSEIDHAHFVLGKNIKDNTQPGPATKVTDCDPGWLPSDFMCK